MRQPLQGTEPGESKSDVRDRRSAGPWSGRDRPSPSAVSGLPANVVDGGPVLYPGIAVHRIGHWSHIHDTAGLSGKQAATSQQMPVLRRRDTGTRPDTHDTGDQTGQRGGVAGSVESGAPPWYNVFVCRGRRANGRLTGGGYAMGAAADPPPVHRGRSRLATRVPTAADPRLLRQVPLVRQ